MAKLPHLDMGRFLNVWIHTQGKVLTKMELRELLRDIQQSGRRGDIESYLRTVSPRATERELELFYEVRARAERHEESLVMDSFMRS